MKPELNRGTVAADGPGRTYLRAVAASRARFFAQSAGSSADLLTLVVAEALERRAQAEIRRGVLRDALYDMPVRTERSALIRRDDDEADADA